MRLLVLATLAALSVAGAAKADPVQDTLNVAADSCIRSNAATVDGYSHSMTESLSFLVDGICAIQVRHAELYEANSRMLEIWRSRPVRPPFYIGASGKPLTEGEKQLVADLDKTNTQIAKINIDPKTGEIIAPLDFEPPNYSIGLMSSGIDNLIKESRFRAIAAEAILAAKRAALRH